MLFLIISHTAHASRTEAAVPVIIEEEFDSTQIDEFLANCITKNANRWKLLYPPAGYILSSELSQPDVTRHSARPARLKYSTRADDT